MTNLDNLLGQTEAAVKTGNAKSIEKIISGDNFQDLHITEAAYNKAFIYAKLVCEIAGGSGTEMIGYLITPKGSTDRVARGVYVAPNQTAGSADVKIEPEDVITSGREIDAMGCKVVGWWHSHGDMSTFHSGTDVANQMTVLNAISSASYVLEKTERKNPDVKLVGNTIVVTDPKHPGVKYEFELKDPGLLNVVSRKVTEDKKIGFAYSLVVHGARGGGFSYGEEKVEIVTEPGTNIKSKLFERKRIPYAEIATRRKCSDCQKIIDESHKVNVLVCKDEIPEVIDEALLRKELEAKVKIRSMFSYFGSWFSGGSDNASTYTPDEGTTGRAYNIGSKGKGDDPISNKTTPMVPTSNVGLNGGELGDSLDLAQAVLDSRKPHVTPIVNPNASSNYQASKDQRKGTPTKKIKRRESSGDIDPKKFRDFVVTTLATQRVVTSEQNIYDAMNNEIMFNLYRTTLEPKKESTGPSRANLTAEVAKPEREEYIDPIELKDFVRDRFISTGRSFTDRDMRDAMEDCEIQEAYLTKKAAEAKNSERKPSALETLLTAPPKQEAKNPTMRLDAQGMEEFVRAKLMESGVKPTKALVAATMGDARMQEWYLADKAERGQSSEGEKK
ncbi:MAG: Mov34/MPN/PAD-1 family protein [archaeon]